MTKSDPAFNETALHGLAIPVATKNRQAGVVKLLIKTLTGARLQEALPDLARLRIEVFREFPYLYDGSPENEESYLSAFTASKDRLIAAAADKGHIIGCATGSALSSHPALAAPLGAANIDPNQVFYCGESVLLPEYRGRGIGHRYFDMREAHARGCGYRYSTFCAVVRPEDHPLKPANFSPLDAFWRKRGYEKVQGAVAQLSWKEISQAQESEHAMQFWMRELS
jgi:GNAT superfamily N-acetyltransferase